MLLVTVLLVVTPVYVASADMQATPVIEPTPTSITAPATPEPTQPAQLIGTPTSESGVQGTGMISPLDIAPGTGALQGCGPTIDIIYPGQSIEFSCLLDFSSLTTGLLDLALVGQVNRSDFVGTSANFDASISIRLDLLGIDLGLLLVSQLPYGSSPGAAQVTLPLAAIAGIDLTSVQVDFSIKATRAVPGDTFSTTFTACRKTSVLALLQSCTGQHGSVSVSLNVPAEEPISGTHYNFSCEPAQHSDLALNVTGESICTLSAGTGLGTKSVRVDQITAALDAVPDGWSVSITDLSDEALINSVPGSWSYSINHPVVTSNFGVFQFKVKMIPMTCTAEPTGPNVGVSLKLMLLEGAQQLGLGSLTSDEIGTSASFDATTTTSVTITSPGDVDYPYSMTTSRAGIEAEFGIHLSVSGCEAWSVDATIDPFVKDGDMDYAGLIPVITEAQHNTDPISIPGTFQLDSATTTGAGGTYNDEIDHTINLVYTIPANTPVGTYTSTITVTVSDAP